MTILTSDYAYLSHMAYTTSLEGDIFSGAPSRNQYIVIDTKIDQFGYYGVIFQNIATNEIVVAHRGTGQRGRRSLAFE